MELVYLLFFLSVPLIIIGYVIFNARHYGWFSYIGILVVTMIGMSLMIPVLNDVLSSTNGNASGNISKTLDDISSSDSMKNFVAVVPFIIIGVGVIFLIWLIIKAVIRFSNDKENFSDVNYYGEKDEKKKEKKREASKFIDIHMKPIRVDGMKQKEKNKEVITSGWSEKK